MGIHCDHLRLYIIRPTLKCLGLWSQFRENLLLGTCAQESKLGTYLVQIGGGPARGIYQMEEGTYIDIWNIFLTSKNPCTDKVFSCSINHFDGFTQIIFNLRYATAMAFMSYYRHQNFKDGEPEDVSLMANYWKKYYNSSSGKGTEQEFIDNYAQCVTESSQ